MEVLSENPVILRMAEEAGGVDVDNPFSGELNVLDGNGDSRIQWDKGDPVQVQSAQARFDELKSRGYLAYKVDATGNQGEVIDKFDPEAERIILHARMIGG